MAIDFIIPKLGDNVTEATIVNWLVEDGAEVSEGDEILEVETDKAVIPIPANGSGHVHLGPFRAGDTVKVDEVVATIGDQAEPFRPGSNGKDSQAQAAATPAPKAEAPAQVERQAQATASQEGGAGQPRATPVAQKMAAELGVDLKSINGSGERGKVTKDDVLRATSAETQPEPAQESRPPAEKLTLPPEPEAKAEPAAKPGAEIKPRPTSSAPPTPEADVLERVPLKGIRSVIARRMAESVQTTARVTLVTEADATELVALREQLKAQYTADWGFAPGYNDLLALIVCNALRQFPYMNARISADGEAIEHLKPIHLGMAVDTERGLLVTVIKDADRQGLREFGSTFRELVGRARSGKASPDELAGGTFTITSLGIYRVDAFTPVINLPEAAILGVGRIKATPVVKGEEIVARQMITLSLVFDHRLTDGAPAARFLDYICELIEDPYLLFLTKR
jgi:pyruvate dehydrogenase E2 component (dihydrolipoamide acetyltransferase)